MKKLIVIALLVVGCASAPPPRDFSLGCQTDLECELWEEQADEAERLQAEQEMEELEYFVTFGKVRK